MEKRWLWLFALFLLFSMIFNVSAEIIFNQQPDEVYSLGDSITFPVTVKALSEISGNLDMILICNGKQVKFFENGVELDSGEEVKMSAVLSKDKIGFNTGECRVKAILEGDYALTNDFQISDLIVVQSKLEQTEFGPGESFIFKGEAVKINGEGANGFVKLSIVSGNDTGSMDYVETVNEGYFSAEVNLPEDMKAGNYLVRVDVYELNLKEEQTNKGFMNYNIHVKQVPTSLEIFFEENEMSPGDKLRVKAILHDQTGDSIDSNVIITLKKSKNEIVQQTELSTDTFLEFDIPYNEIPANWSVFAVSNLLDSESSFVIKEKKDLLVEIANGTIFLTNKGNVLYNDSVLVKIGENSSFNLDVFLDVDEVKKYELNAPDGEYAVEIVSDGESRFRDSVILTGRSIDVKELRSFGLSGFNIIIWIFILLVLGFVAFLIVKKGYKRSFWGSLKFKKKHESLKKNSEPLSKKAAFLLTTKNRARLSLSIKGEKQESAFVCLRIKNRDSLDKKGISDAAYKVSGIAESSKAMIYENNESIFFIFSPLKTKTFRNEVSAINLAKEIEQVLNYHNKLFKHKIDFGISINTGYAVSNVNDSGELEFVTMGNIIPSLKKMAFLSQGEVFLGKEFKDKAGSIMKTKEKAIDGMKVYIIQEMRNREKYNKFINNFLSNLERDKKEMEKREK